MLGGIITSMNQNNKKKYTKDELYQHLFTDESRVPDGYKEIENVTGVFVGNGEIVITGHPDPADETHNCDEMGCSSVEHVIFRTSIDTQ